MDRIPTLKRTMAALNITWYNLPCSFDIWKCDVLDNVVRASNIQNRFLTEIELQWNLASITSGIWRQTKSKKSLYLGEGQTSIFCWEEEGAPNLLLLPQTSHRFYHSAYHKILRGYNSFWDFHSAQHHSNVTTTRPKSLSTITWSTQGKIISASSEQTNQELFMLWYNII